MPSRDVTITVKFSAAERDRMLEMARVDGKRLRSWMRDRLTSDGTGLGGPEDTLSTFVEMCRLREFVARLAEHVGVQGIGELTGTVDAVDERVFLARRRRNG